MRSFARQVLLCRDEVGSRGVRAACQRDELRVVGPSLRPVAGPVGGHCGARKRAIAVRIVAQRRLEFFQRLLGLLRFHQQFAQQFPDRRQAIFHRDMLAAPIFEIGGLAHRRDGLRFVALDERDPGFAGPLLDGNLARPIRIVRLVQPVLEGAQLIDSFLRLREISVAGSADRAAEPRYRLGLRERRFRDGKRRGLGPGGALKGIADRNGCKGGVSAVAESCRILGNAVARIDNAFRLLVLRPAADRHW